ncbi:MAG: hypothetical protein JSS11_01415 [Verrucomicrobia bacterium]|nr:hypothetical protein [Verrucomicrobiota bacterium]
MSATPLAAAFAALQRRYRIVLTLFIIGLILSGVTAFPLLTELRWLCDLLGVDQTTALAQSSGLAHWLARVRAGLEANARDYPFIAYGTDWLAFGHLAIAVFFIRPVFKPLESDWVLRCGLVCCAGVIPLALIAGPLRGIPFYWRLIDCSFGVLGAIPLLYCLRLTRRMRATT